MLDRIRRMEELLDEINDSISSTKREINRFLKLEDKKKELEAYYASSKYMEDFEAYEKDEVKIKCGVLAEDSIYDTLEEWDYLEKVLKSMKED